MIRQEPGNRIVKERDHPGSDLVLAIGVTLSTCVTSAKSSKRQCMLHMKTLLNLKIQLKIVC